MRLDYSVYNTTTTASYKIIGYVVTYVHIVASDFHDTEHEKNQRCAGSIYPNTSHQG